MASPTVLILPTSSPLSFTPYSSSMIWDSSARSSESTSSSSKVDSSLMSSASGPNWTSASRTVVSTASGVTVSGMSWFLSLVQGWCGLSTHAAVDEQRRAGHVAGVVGGEEAHGGGNFLGRARPLGGHGLHDGVGDVLGHRGGDEAGGDRVEGHAALRHLGGDGLGHADQAGLGGRGVGLAGAGARPDDRRDVDHAAEAGLDHRAHRPARHAEGGGQVRVDDLVPLLVLELDREPVGGDAGVVDEREHRAELCLELGEEVVGDAVGIGYVALDGDGLAAGFLDRLDGLLGALLVGAVVDSDVPAVGGQRDRDRGTDALGGAGDECGGVVRSGLLAHAGPPHSRTAPPHVTPAPTAATSTVSPGCSRSSSRANASASGIEAADVLPMSPRESAQRSTGTWSRSATAFVMRALAW